MIAITLTIWTIIFFCLWLYFAIVEIWKSEAGTISEEEANKQITHLFKFFAFIWVLPFITYILSEVLS